MLQKPQLAASVEQGPDAKLGRRQSSVAPARSMSHNDAQQPVMVHQEAVMAGEADTAAADALTGFVVSEASQLEGVQQALKEAENSSAHAVSPGDQVFVPYS